LGYTTKFKGSFEIYPPLSDEQVDELNEFCKRRHGGSVNTFDYAPSMWCDWFFTNDSMMWNDSEKSYCMSTWANILSDMFMKEHTITGEIRARGEEFDDVWTMVADGRGVWKRVGWRLSCALCRRDDVDMRQRMDFPSDGKHCAWLCYECAPYEKDTPWDTPMEEEEE